MEHSLANHGWFKVVWKSLNRKYATIDVLFPKKLDLKIKTKPFLSSFNSIIQRIFIYDMQRLGSKFCADSFITVGFNLILSPHIFIRVCIEYACIMHSIMCTSGIHGMTFSKKTNSPACVIATCILHIQIS